MRSWANRAVLVLLGFSRISRAIVEEPIATAAQGSNVARVRHHRLVRRAESVIELENHDTGHTSADNGLGLAKDAEAGHDLPRVALTRDEFLLDDGWELPKASASDRSADMGNDTLVSLPQVEATRNMFLERYEEILSQQQNSSWATTEINGTVLEDRTNNNENPTVLATAAPLTLLHVLAHYQEKLFLGGFMPNPFRIHILGATYPFEGRGNWMMLGDVMPWAGEVEILLVLGTPDQKDGVPAVDINKQHRIVCGQRGGKRDNVRVSCMETYYQNLFHADNFQSPHLAVMFNPGFPQVSRRSWDPTLLFLLKHEIPTIVSAQLISNTKGWPVPGQPWGPAFNNSRDEDFAVATTLRAYGAESWGMIGSPFPIRIDLANQNMDIEDQSRIKLIKNGAIVVFKGTVDRQKLPLTPLAVSDGDMDFLRRLDSRMAALTAAEKQLSLNEELGEARKSLQMPVSECYTRAADAVYLQYMEKISQEDSFKSLSPEVSKRATVVMDRMRRMEELSAEEWIFLLENFQKRFDGS